MVNKFEEKTASIFYDTTFGEIILQPLVVFIIAGSIGVGLEYLINLL